MLGRAVLRIREAQGVNQFLNQFNQFFSNARPPNVSKKRVAQDLGLDIDY